MVSRSKKKKHEEDLLPKVKVVRQDVKDRKDYIKN
jgi:hypothetical protein